MKTIYLKSEPLMAWQKPTYYKLIGSDNDITEVSVWNATSLELSHTDDETWADYINYIKGRDTNHPLIEIQRKEFDTQYIKLTNKLNNITSI